ncbi:PstS family phosphate ABC transporter substrate-binding protein [Alteribacillus sp. HJP-4]|uniref:PstS family phosphate ABC transporter substrate-binding protein n=1 Tax=Alteribacillus sp. HJP-4 TaxID=2775394 RepID=UPI0035CD2621
MKKFLSITSFAALFGIMAACGNGDGTESPEETGQEEAQETSGEEGSSEEGGASGDVAIDGSSTVFPIMEAVSEEYSIAEGGVNAPVGVSGTGGGFEKFINGETDIQNASRPISDEEKELLEENEIEYTEFELALDGLSVVVNQENDFVDYLTVEELEAIYLEDGGVETWSDVRDEWPDEPIELYSPGTDSGTYDYFNEVILEDQAINRDASLSEDDNVLVQGVQGSNNAIGYFGYAYYVENQDTLRAVPIENSEGDQVEPSLETVQSGEYEPLSRPMFLYVNNDSLKENDAVYGYMEFALENAGDLSEEVGYIALPEEDYEANLEELESAAE